MADRRFRVVANFPTLGNDAHQEIEVMAGSWTVAIGKAARQLRKLPIMHRRRITGMSIMLEQREGQPSTLTPGPSDPLRFPVDSPDESTEDTPVDMTDITDPGVDPEGSEGA